MPNLSDYNPAIKYGANLDVNVDLADIRDANNNELLELDTVTSAVNYVRIANAAAGSNPVLSSQGDDTNISLELTPAGTGVVVLGTRATGTQSGASVTVNAVRGQIVTGTLNLGSGLATTIVLTNNRIQPNSDVHVRLQRWSGSTGQPVITHGTTAAGSHTFNIVNIPVPSNGSAFLDGTAAIAFVVL